MKRANVLQLTIILLGIIFGFLSLQYLISSLLVVFSWFFQGGYGGGEMGSMSLSIFSIVGLQVLCCWILITKSRNISEIIYDKSGLDNDFKIISKPNDLLYILLITIGIYLFLSNITPMLSGIFRSFKRTASSGVFESLKSEIHVEWTELILKLTLPLILLMFAKPIADYFAKNLSEEPISIEESIDTDQLIETKDN